MGALMKWLNSRPGEPELDPQPTRSMDELRRLSLATLADCRRPHDELLRGEVARARNAQQLWQMRCDLYQAIARRHCESEAVRRLNDLLPAFEGWLPPASLRRL
jgi:hypothetical protein